MTFVLVTIDTELWLAAHQRGVSPDENFARAIVGRTRVGDWGVGYQARKLAEHGLKGVFFVEALSAGVSGLDYLRHTIDPILGSGHSVELHIHTEWLPWLARDPVDGRRGRCMADFDLADQTRLIELGIENLTRAGAPVPIAFRAGNYGANDDTLRALARLGIRYDTSYNVPYIGDPCRISAERPLFDLSEREGLVEVPVTCFQDYPGHFRPVQLCAISASEIRHVVDKSITLARNTTTIVSHSFELLNTARTKVNSILVRRFEETCGYLESVRAAAPTISFSNINDGSTVSAAAIASPLSSNLLRTAMRMAQQGVGNVLYK